MEKVKLLRTLVFLNFKCVVKEIERMQRGKPVRIAPNKRFALNWGENQGLYVIYDHDGRPWVRFGMPIDIRTVFPGIKGDGTKAPVPLADDLEWIGLHFPEIQVEEYFRDKGLTFYNPTSRQLHRAACATMRCENDGTPEAKETQKKEVERFLARARRHEHPTTPISNEELDEFDAWVTAHT